MKIEEGKPHMTLPNGDKVYEGGFARTRDGRKVGPIQKYNSMYWHIGDGTTEEHGYLWNHCGIGQGNVDIIAEWIDEPETQPETGTLEQLNVKPGDVVEWIEVKSKHTVLWVEKITKGTFIGQVRADLSDYGYGVFDEEKFRIVSRASQPDTPKLWRDMTPEEKGVLLLAHHEGGKIEVCFDLLGDWRTISEPMFADNRAYRIRPEPKRETVALCWKKGLAMGEVGTIDLIDGQPDPASIRMEEIK